MDITYLRFANSILEPVWNRQLRLSRADDDGRGLRRRGPRPLLRPGRGAARRGPEPPAAGARAGRDGAARPATDHDSIRDKKLDLFKAMPRGRPEALRARPVRRLPATSRASPRTRPPRPSPRSSWRSTTGAGPASPSSSAPASACRARSTEVRVVFKRPPPLGIGGARRARAERDRSSGSTPTPGAQHPARGQEGRARRRSRRVRPRRAVREAARRGARALRAPARRRARRQPASCFTREDAIEETWRIVQPLLDEPPRARAVRAGDLGAGRRQPPGRRARRLAHAVDAAAQRRSALVERAALASRPGSRDPWTGRERGDRMRRMAGWIVAVACLAGAAPADAAISSVFNGDVSCAVQGNGVRFCGSNAPRSHDEDLRRRPDRRQRRLPAGARVGPGRPVPAGHDRSTATAAAKLGLGTMQPWLDAGYATFSMTDRGFGESCGSTAARAADPAGCAAATSA